MREDLEVNDIWFSYYSLGRPFELIQFSSLTKNKTLQTICIINFRDRK